ncbi:MAG: TonB-dependent receptor [Lentimicrobiaceae bacterium]|nr:TonB-dependent receptor [Lentimicrobiaceae bacterium]
MIHFLLKSISLIFASALITGQLFAQVVIRGQVSDLSSGYAIANVNIQADTKNNGAITDNNGNFEIILAQGSCKLTFSHLTYKPLILSLNTAEKNEFLHIRLEPETVGLNEVNIISNYARERETPIAISNIRTATIEREMGHQDYPEIMKLVPGVYATKLGGGQGDARISIRGFQQENIALLLNGVPVSSVENGLVYWSNWAGLGDATQTIQVQRGLGASRVALNSVGGTINIITKSTEAIKGGSIRYAVSDFGNNKFTLSLSTGKLNKNYAITFLGSRTSGPGYVDATSVNAWAWFLTISKELNERHKIVFTSLGAPERHGQRNFGLSKEEYDMYGNKYNPNWGIYNGKINSLSENFYHKPQLSLNHYWDINPRAFLATSVYFSSGKGGGKYAESFMSEPVYNFRKNNQLDWDAVYLQNINHNDTYQLADGQIASGFSKIIQTNYLADHIWFGALSTLNYQINDNFKFISGIHARYFKSNLREEISDLLGGRFYIDTYGWAIDGIGGRNQIKGVGDIINVDNDSRVDVISYFGQIEYTYKNLTTFLASTASSTWFRRYDRINYIQNPESELVSKPGADIKTGLNYNINARSNLYLNAGYYTKAPYYKFIFANFTNAVVQNASNEKISSAEMGYGYKNKGYSVNINAYYTLWQDKSLLSNENIQLDNNTQTRALIRGLDAVHKGIEVEIFAQPTSNFLIGSTFSAGDWKWKNDVNALLYNDNQELVDSTFVYVKDIKVGDAPQISLALFGELRFLTDWALNANWLYYSKIYANFDPAGRGNPDDRSQPYRIPDYDLLDLHLSYQFEISGLKSTAAISCYNVTNKESIMRGEDGTGHNLETFRGYWSPGRTFNFSLKVSF